MIERVPWTRGGECHASTLLCLDGGDVLLAWFGGSREGADDVGIWVSRRTPTGFSAPVQVAGNGYRPHWNPVLFGAPDGTIWLFYKVGRRIPEWRTWVTRSADGGLTWSTPAELVPGDDTGGRGPVKNKPIIASDGGWLAPASREGERWAAFVDRSADGGRTWTASRPVGLDVAGPARGLIQPALWESEPGVVRMLARSTEGWVHTSASADGGLTWSAPAPTELPNNNSGLDVTRLVDGLLVCAHNPVGSNWGARTPLVLSLSADDGITWKAGAVTIEDTPAPADLRIEGADTGIRTDGRAEFSYPAVVPYADGVALSYTWQRRTIAFAVVPGRQLRGSTVQSGGI